MTLKCAVVDAFGIARYLPAALRRHGVEPIHVRSDTPDRHLQYRPEDFDVDIQHCGDIATTARALRENGVGFVVAGVESGVLLADALSDALGTPGNGMRRPLSRRNKYEMALAIRDAGLAAADSCASASANEIVEWALARRWPIVLKPLMSCGMDNVHFCRSEDDIRSAHAAILSSTDRYNRRNDIVLAQEFLDGDEYFVNTVSRGGVHHIVEIWRYNKQKIDSTRAMVSNEHPVPFTDPEAMTVAAYTLEALDALEIHNGAAHAEVMLTANRGPVLVECAARPGGAHIPEIVSRCIGTDQIDCLAAAIARPSDVIEQKLAPYRLLTNVRFMNLIMPGPGRVPMDDEGWAPLRNLPSFLQMQVTQTPGKRFDRTVDLASVPGYVYLSSDDAAQVAADYEAIRKLEAGGLYQ